MDEFEINFNKTLRFLSFRPRSEKEVADYLSQKNVDEKIGKRIIARLKELKFLDDREFARMWIEERTKIKPRSLRLIKLELKQKGISQDIIDEISQNSELRLQSDKEMAKKVIFKKIEKYKGLSKFALLQKLGPFLARRGFDYDTIKKAIDESVGKGV